MQGKFTRAAGKLNLIISSLERLFHRRNLIMLTVLEDSPLLIQMRRVEKTSYNQFFHSKIQNDF